MKHSNVQLQPRSRDVPYTHFPYVERRNSMFPTLRLENVLGSSSVAFCRHPDVVNLARQSAIIERGEHPAYMFCPFPIRLGWVRISLLGIQWCKKRAPSRRRRTRLVRRDVKSRIIMHKTPLLYLCKVLFGQGHHLPLLPHLFHVSLKPMCNKRNCRGYESCAVVRFPVQTSCSCTKVLVGSLRDEELGKTTALLLLQGVGKSLVAVLYSCPGYPQTRAVKSRMVGMSELPRCFGSLVCSPLRQKMRYRERSLSLLRSIHLHCFLVLATLRHLRVRQSLAVVCHRIEGVEAFASGWSPPRHSTVEEL